MSISKCLMKVVVRVVLNLTPFTLHVAVTDTMLLQICGHWVASRLSS